MIDATLYADISTARGSSVITVAWRLLEQVEAGGADVIKRGIVDREGHVQRRSVGWFHGYPQQLQQAVMRPGIHGRRVAGLQVDASPVPRDWRRLTRGLDLIYCPSSWCVDQLRPIVGPGTRTILVPHGIDPPASALPYELPERFTALCVSLGDHGGSHAWAHHLRKGVDVAVEACWLAGVNLVLKAGTVAQSWLAESGYSEHVTVVDDWLHPGQLSDLLRSVHVVLVPSRSEAFGLVAAEALAHGVPVIATDGTGMDDYLPHDERVVRIKGAIPVYDLPTFGLPTGKVLDVHATAAARALNEAREGYEARRSLAESEARKWTEVHSWENAAAQLVDWICST